MKDEIKEIIRLNCEEEIDVKYFAKDNSLVYTTMDYSQLLDYITNLQKEKEEFRLLKERYQLIKEIYKQRIDKAIEYLNEPNRDEFDYSITYLLEILQGGDE